MKRLFGILSLSTFLFNILISNFTYANNDIYEDAKEILISEVERVLENYEFKSNTSVEIGDDLDDSGLMPNVEIKGNAYLMNNDIKETSLINGGEFNVMLKKLVTGNGSNIGIYDNVGGITSFTGSSFITEELQSIAYNVASGSNIPFYIWYDSGIVYYYTDADIVYLDKDSSYMFAHLPQIETIDLSMFNTSNVENMMGMFSYCYKLKMIDFANFDTKRVENMKYMFYYCNALKSINNMNFDTRNVNNMSYMFSYCTSLESVDVSGFNTSNVTDMGWMFDHCTSLTSLDVSNFIMTGVTNIYQFVAYSPKLETLNISNWDISNLNDQRWYMAQNDPKLKNVIARNMTVGNGLSNWYNKFFGWLETIEFIDATDWKRDMTRETNMEQMFYYAKNLKVLRGLETWNVSNVTNMRETFRRMEKIEELNIKNWDVSKVKDMYEIFQYNGLKKIDISGWKLDSIENMSYMFQSCYSEEIDMSNISVNNKNGITNFNFLFQSSENLKNIKMKNINLESVDSFEYLFQSLSSLQNVDLSYAKLNNVKTMNSMFEGSKNLENIDLVGVETSSLENMRNMFNGCNKLKEINLSSFDTNNVSDMGYIFSSNYSLEKIYVGTKFSTGSVLSGESMFYGDVNLLNYDPDLVGVEYSPRYLTNGEFLLNYNLNGGNIDKLKNTYFIRERGELGEPLRQGYEFVGWFENGINKKFILDGTNSGDKILNAQWKALEEKAQESATENVTYTNGTTVTIGSEVQDETINNSSMINLVSKEVEQHEIKEEDDKTTVQESEIQVTSDKTVEYQGGLEVYLEKTTNIGEEETKERIEGTAKFSSPVAVKIPITSNAEIVKVQVKHEWEDFGYTGLTLNPYNECVNGEAVNDKYNGENIGVIEINGEKYALIYTCSASTFVAYTENSKPVVVNESNSTPTPAAGGGRIISTTTNMQPAIEPEHSSADIENKSIEQNVTTQAKEIVIDSKILQRSLTRGEVAVMTNILLDVFPQLVEGKQELDNITNACSNYADEQKFTKDEKKAITRLCKLSIMGIHADYNKPLDEFMVNERTKNDEFSKVINRSLSTYTEKDFTVVKETLKKLEDNEENIEFGTVYNVFMSIKALFN